MAAVPYELTKKDLTAWRELLGTPNREKTVLAAALAALQMAAVPFSENHTVFLLYYLLTLSFFYLLTRSLFSLCGVAIPAFFIYSAFGEHGAPFSVAFCAMLFGGALCAYLILHFHTKPAHLLFLLIPAAAYGVTFLMTGDPMRGLLTLIPLPLGLLFAVMLARCDSFTDTVGSGAAAVALTLAEALLLTLAATGRLSSNALSLLADDLRANLVSRLTEVRDLYEKAGISLEMTDVQIANSAAMWVNLSPAIYLILCSVISFCSFRIFLRVTAGFDELPRMPRRVIAMSVSPVAAILFLVAFLLSLLVGRDHASFFGVVLQNLYLVLEPPLILVGFSALSGRGGARSCLSLLILMGLVFILCTNPGTGLTLAAFYGALTILLSRFFPAAPADKGGQ